jgi:hypothetical protein
VLPNKIMLLVTIEKFETNHVLVNMNKFKPYKYMESKVYKKNNNKCQYIGKRMQVEFRRRILTQKRSMADVKYRNHR